MYVLRRSITCVHIIQLKVLTCIRVGNKQKKIDISIPKLNNFVHRVYINTARKIFSNIFRRAVLAAVQRTVQLALQRRSQTDSQENLYNKKCALP